VYEVIDTRRMQTPVCAVFPQPKPQPKPQPVDRAAELRAALQRELDKAPK